jgi:biotin synthase-related radical SAM superfamily protein
MMNADLRDMIEVGCEEMDEAVFAFAILRYEESEESWDRLVEYVDNI